VNLEQLRLKIGLNSKDQAETRLPVGSGVVLRYCGSIDPESIDDYILRAGGYSGLARALQMSPEDVISELSAAGLRGRGGAGYKTADKWHICRLAEGTEKYLVCNALDSDPASNIARLILEGNPHSVLEGLLIGAYAVGASIGYICAGAENSLAVRRLNSALKQMRESNLLGNRILDSGFSAEIILKEVPSCLVAGEETALIRSLENKQAKPFIRPPYPAAAGLKNRPTVVNHLETLADAALILQQVPEWVHPPGTEQSRGTKIITVCGDVSQSCTLEVPLGTTLRSIIEKSGATVTDIRAVQVGGPTGTFLTAGSLDLPFDFESLKQAGAIMGSGTIEVFSGSRCMLQAAAEKMVYLHEQSCGKCVFCREGTYQMADILADMVEYKGKSPDLELLFKLGKLMQQGSICNLGKNAPAPVLSSLNLFKEDYAEHLKGENGRCRYHKK
jgi:NADH-quinone oxidoreductase subunit F